MRYLRHTVLVAMIAVATVGGSIVGAPVGGAQAAPFTMTTDPTHGVAGDQVEVTATSCVDPDVAARLVFLGFSGPAAGLALQVGTATADGNGSFTTSITVPQVLRNPGNPNYGGLVTAGDYQIVALPVPEGQPAPCGAAFHVDRSVTLELSVSPTTGPAGSTVAVSGLCFTPEQLSVSVHAEVDGEPLPDGAVGDVTSKGPSDLPMLEVWAGSVTLPADLADGTVVSFVGTCGLLDYVPATFVVATASTPAAATDAVAVAVTPALTG